MVAHRVLQSIAAIFGLLAFIIGVVRVEPFFGPLSWFYAHCVGPQKEKFEAKGGFVPLGGKRQIQIIARLIHKLHWTRLFYIRNRTAGDSLEDLQAQRQRKLTLLCVLVSTVSALIAIWTA